MNSNQVISAFQGVQTLGSQELVPVEPSKGIEDDFEKSRKNLIQMMQVTMGAITNMSIISSQSQMPEAYDVLNKLIRTYNEQQEQLLRFYRIKEAKDSKPAAPVEGQVVDQRTQSVHFHGTPAELSKALEAAREQLK
jgi:hypothetical protein